MGVDCLSDRIARLWADGFEVGSVALDGSPDFKVRNTGGDIDVKLPVDPSGRQFARAAAADNDDRSECRMSDAESAHALV